MVKRDNRHIWVGIGFVVAAIAIAGAVYFGMKLGAGTDAAQPETSADVVADVQATPEAALPVEAPERSKVDVLDAILGKSFSYYENRLPSVGEPCNGSYTLTFNFPSPDGVMSYAGVGGEVVNFDGNFSLDGDQIRFFDRSVTEFDDTGELAEVEIPDTTQTIKVINAGEIQLDDERLVECTME